MGSIALDSSGSASYTVTGLSAGSHSYLASYSGDANFAFSDSTELSVTVDAAPTTIKVTSSPNPAVNRDDVTLTASVTSPAGAPTGEVTFKDGSTTLGTGTLNGSGEATNTASGLALGNHSITASYAGDGSFAPSTSEALNMPIYSGSFSMGFQNSGAQVRAGQRATYMFTVSPRGTMTEPITFGCTGLPANSNCTFDPPTLTLGKNAAQETLTIGTKGRTGGTWLFNLPLNVKRLLFMALALLTSLTLFLARRRKEQSRRERRRFAWGATLAMALGFVLAGCGGSSTATPTDLGTPTGTYTVLVTGTSGTQTITSQVTLTVQ